MTNDEKRLVGTLKYLEIRLSSLGLDNLAEVCGKEIRRTEPCGYEIGEDELMNIHTDLLYDRRGAEESYDQGYDEGINDFLEEAVKIIRYKEYGDSDVK